MILQPFLTIVLNNGGWKSPKLSLLGVHPAGYGSLAGGDELSVGFGPTAPDYAGIASAAGGAWGQKVKWFEKAGASPKGDRGDAVQGQESGLNEIIKEAVRVVKEERRCAVVDCVIEKI